MTILLFSLAQALDAMTTSHAITYLGAEEMIPTTAAVIAVGWDTFLVAKLLGALAFVPIYAFFTRFYAARQAQWALSLGVFVAWVPVIANIGQLILFGD